MNTRTWRARRGVRAVAMCLAALLGLQASLCHAQTAGDRGERVFGRTQYPQAALVADLRNQKGAGAVLDVRRFGADPAPGNDDTQALIDAYSYVVDRLRPYRALAQKPFQAPNYIIYLPDGVYDVSRPIVYGGEPIDWQGEGGKGGPRETGQGQIMENLVGIRFIGQTRGGTVIRLRKSSAPFGDPARPQAVLSFARREFNNVQAGNVVRNLTIEVEEGNPGAIGIAFAGANNTNIRNVTVRGQGRAGLAFRVPPTQGYHHDITVEGFDYGVEITAPYQATHVSLEYLTLQGQRRAGVLLGDDSLSLRRVSFQAEAKVPFLRMDGAGGAAVIVDSQATGGVERGRDRGALLVRNSTLAGQRVAESLSGAELNGHRAVAQFRSLSLPVEELPEFPRLGADDWAVVTATGDGRTDDYDAIERALSSGKPGVLLASQRYCLELSRHRRALRIPPTVRQIVGVFSQVRAVERGSCSDPQAMGTTWSISEGAADASPLLIEDLSSSGGVFVISQAPRPLVLSQLRTQGTLFRHPADDKMRLHLVNVTGYGKDPDAIRSLDGWARFINTETAQGVDFPLIDSTLWVFGFKTEKVRTNFRVQRSQLEVLGGMVNQYEQAQARRKAREQGGTADAVVLDMVSGAASMWAMTNGPASGLGFDNIVRQPPGQTLPRSAFAPRPGRGGQAVIAISIDTDGSAAAAGRNKR